MGVLSYTIKKSGYWNFKELYEFCFNWFKDHGVKVGEDDYTEKDSGAKEIKINWSMKKKYTDYFAGKMTLKWHITQLVDAEIDRGGKKEKTNKGDLKLTFDADLASDQDGVWEKHPKYKFLRGLYDRYIIKTTADEYEGKLRGLGLAFIADVKAYLELTA